MAELVYASGMNLADWLRTLNAIQIVLRDSNRTEQIHVVEETTGKRRMAVALEGIRSSPEGRALLERRPELNRELVDYDALRRLPPKTLGGAYIRHLDDNGLSADTQATATQFVDDPEIAYLIRRFRQTHDVWHPLTGLGTQPYEEVTIHAFSYGQLELPVSALIIWLGGIKHGLLERRWDMLRRTLYDAYKKGRDAAPLLGVVWEDQWAEPLADVRRRYRIDPVASPPS
jgi:ubiquinone biosynthesis protein COQ4